MIIGLRLNALAAHVEDDDKKDALIQGSLGGTQKMTVINEQHKAIDRLAPKAVLSQINMENEENMKIYRYFCTFKFIISKKQSNGKNMALVWQEG